MSWLGIATECSLHVVDQEVAVMADSQEVPWIVPATIRNGNNVMRFHDASPRKLFLFPPANLAKTKLDAIWERIQARKNG